MTYKKFRTLIWNFYHENKRVFPWRKTRDPYAILVSEIMLQQTQTDRVIPKYEHWLTLFPTVETLATAKLQDVLQAWQGLGYNRRALALKRAAEAIIEGHTGKFPRTYEELLDLPGIGPYTAGAIMAFAYNKPVPIIETNIRTVFIHSFFSKDHGMIHDEEIMNIVTKTMNHENPREWYWALMDYGAHLKKLIGNPNRRSKHYTRQSSFIGSNRQIRSAILRRITESPATDREITQYMVREHITATPEQIIKNCMNLEREGFIKKSGKRYAIV